MRGPFASRFVPQQLVGEDQLLDLAGALIDAERADLAIEALDRMPRDDAHAAEELHGIVNNAFRGFRSEQLRHGSFPWNAIGTDVARPGGAIDKQSAGVDGERHFGKLRL